MLAKGHFFAVERRVWDVACDLGMNEAVAYLIVCRGTLSDNRTTSWSVKAIEQRTGISRSRAKAALTNCKDAGLFEVVKTGTRPRRRLNKAWMVPGTDAYIPQTEDELREEWLSSIRSGSYAEYSDDDNSEIDESSEWIWLPNSIVDPPNKGVSPLERIRVTGSVNLIYTFVLLYHKHHLNDNGGLHWNIYSARYERAKLISFADHTVWRFRRAGEHVGRLEGGLEFGPALQALVRVGFVQIVEHVVENSGPDAEVIHPYPKGTGQDIEQGLRIEGEGAARAILDRYGIDQDTDDDVILLPAKNDYIDVSIVGVARLKYMPFTTATELWARRLGTWRRWQSTFKTLRTHAESPSLATSKRHQ